MTRRPRVDRSTRVTSELTVLFVAILGGLGWASASLLPKGPDDLARLLLPAVGTPCSIDGPLVEVRGVGHASFNDLAYDGRSGEALLQGGVCIELVDLALVVRSNEIALSNLDGARSGDEPPALNAEQTAIDLGPWRLWAERLEGTVASIELRDAVMLGPGTIASIDRMSVAAGVTLFEGLSLVTDRYLVTARQGRMEGDDLVLDGVVATSCACRDAPFTLLGREARVHVAGARAEGMIDDPTLGLLGAELSLGGSVRLGPSGLDLDLPFSVRRDATLGLLLEVRGASEADDSVLAWGVAPDLDSLPWATLGVTDGATTVRGRYDARGLLIEATRDLEPFLGGASAAYLLGDLASAPTTFVGGGALTWTGGSPNGEGSLTSSWRVRAAAEALLERDGPGVARAGVGVPLKAQVELAASLTTDASVSLRSELRTAPSLRLDGAAKERLALPLALTLRPRLDLRAGSWTAFVQAQRHVVLGSSPFTRYAESEVARVASQLTWTRGATQLRFRAEVRLAPETPGVEHLDLRASTALSGGSAWTFTPVAVLDLAPFVALGEGVTLDLDLTAQRSEHLRFDVGGAVDVSAGSMTRLTTRATVPFALALPGGELLVAPTVGVDLLPWLRGEGAAIEEHGLRFELEERSGTYFAAYRRVGGALTIDLGVVLPPFRISGPPAAALPNVAALTDSMP